MFSSRYHLVHFTVEKYQGNMNIKQLNSHLHCYECMIDDPGRCFPYLQVTTSASILEYLRTIENDLEDNIHETNKKPLSN